MSNKSKDKPKVHAVKINQEAKKALLDEQHRMFTVTGDKPKLEFLASEAIRYWCKMEHEG